MLPRDKRRAMTALYAFARHSDDLGDSARTTADRRRALQAWRAATLQSLSCSDPAAIEFVHDPSAPAAVQRAARDLLPALADAAQRYAIPQQHLLEIVDGVIADQSQTRYESFEELERYCYLVASAVGLACMHIWQHAPELPRAAAVDCGIAFQLTNILRDVREDAELGRIYLPRQWWAPRGLREVDFQSPEPPPQMVGFLRETAARARSRFAHGWQVAEHLHPDGRRMFSMMWHTYSILLDRIEADPAAVFRHRVKLGQRDRLWIIGSHLIGPWFRHLQARSTAAVTQRRVAGDEHFSHERPSTDSGQLAPHLRQRRPTAIVSGPLSERRE